MISESDILIDRSKRFLTLDQVTIRLRDRFVFEDTSWQIRSDEQWAVIGPNGAGKSTLVKALAGDLPIVRGRAVYHFLEEPGLTGSVPNGQVARVAFDTERDFHRAKAGFDSFSPEQNGEVTVAETLLWESSTGESTGEDKLREIAQKLGMEHLLGRAGHLLSNGEAKKVLLARALLRSPSLLILDEPYEGLDERAKMESKALVDSLMTGPMRVILVTHRFGEISPKVSHVLCVKDCRVMMQGSAEDMLKPEMISRIYGERGLGEEGKGFYSRPQKEMRPSASQELIRMRNTTVRYGGHVVLDHIDWTVRRGENWAVLGPNGAGKSKLLELITGDNVQGYANDIHLFGRKKGSGETVWEIKEKLSIVSAEFQMRYQKPIPAYNVICSGFFDSVGLYHGCTEEQHRAVRDWIGFLGMADLARKRFDYLSHGQQRLILLARAMVKSPLLMILDEPCDGLDYANRRNVLEFIEFIGSRTATDLIYVTHHKDEIPRCITHALVLDKGKVVAVGEKREETLSAF
jgi:molybdate transport system ATP-binding protein